MIRFNPLNPKVIFITTVLITTLGISSLFLHWQTLWVAAGALLGAGLWFSFKILQAKRFGRQLQHAMQSQQDGHRHKLEIEALKSAMLQSIGRLKTSELGVTYQGSAALYALPWYIVIGPAAAGKSTLLRQSGMRFPMDAQQEIQVRGFGGTRNCDWWFADSAVFLDTAGRYTTEPDDREEWLSFLKLVKKFRPKQPINGLIVAITLSDLLTQAEQLESHAQLIRERLQEISSTLGFIVPTTLVLTKCDQLKGFGHFFKDAESQDKKQPLGIHFFDNEPVDSRNGVIGKLNMLYAQFALDRAKKLQSAETTIEKKNIIDFPENFQAIIPHLNRFLSLIAERNPYQDTPFVAGLYLTSALQDNRQMLVAPEADSKVFQLMDVTAEEYVTSNDSYFVKSLFQNVIVPQRYLLKRNPIQQRRHRMQQMVFYTASFAGLALFSVGSWKAYQHNQVLLQQGVWKMAELARTMQFQITTQKPAQIAAQAVVHEHLVALKNYSKQIPMALRMGLYRGDKQLPAMSEALATTLQTTFVQPLAESLHQQLVENHQTWLTLPPEDQAAYYDAYHALLGDYFALQAPTGVDIPRAAKSLAGRWENLLKEQNSGYQTLGFQSETLFQLVEFYLHHRQQYSDGFFQYVPDMALIATAQKDLILPQAPHLLYQQVMEGLQETMGIVDPNRQLKTTLWQADYPLSTAYTTEEWFKTVQPKLLEKTNLVAEGDSIIGHVGYNVINKESLFSEMKALYEKDYQQQWLSFLNGLSVKAFDNLDQASTALYALSDAKGMYPELFRWIAANQYNATALGEIQIFANQAAEPTDLLKQYLLVISRLQNDVLRISKSSEAPQLALTYAQKLLNQNGMDTELYKASVVIDTLVMGVQDKALQQALSHLLLSPVQTTWGSILNEAADALQAMWDQDVLTPFDDKLASRYPFSKVEDEVAVSDLSAFFKPHTGILWEFVETNLLPFMTTTRSAMTPKQWLGKSLPVSPALLASIQKAQRLTQSLFHKEGQEIGFDYFVYPVATAGVQELSLTTNQDTYRYRNEPQEWRRFSWPGDMSTLSAKIAAISQQGQQGKLQTQGVWSLFKLLEKAEFSATNQGKYVGRWRLKTDSGEMLQCSFMFKGDRKDNLFEQLFVTPLQLPKNIKSSEVG